MDRRTVLFTCSLNAVRSPMAEILLNHYGGERYESWSRRSIDGEAGELADYARRFLRDVGVPEDAMTRNPRALPPRISLFVALDAEGSARNATDLEVRLEHPVEAWTVTPPLGAAPEACRDAYEDLRGLFAERLDVRLPPLPPLA